MDFNEFLLLSSEQRCNLVWEEGIYIMGKIKGEYTYNLYSVFSYYAEITFNLSKNCYESIQVFRASNFLDTYLEEINLPFLDLA